MVVVGMIAQASMSTRHRSCPDVVLCLAIGLHTQTMAVPWGWRRGSFPGILTGPQPCGWEERGAVYIPTVPCLGPKAREHAKAEHRGTATAEQGREEGGWLGAKAFQSSGSERGLIQQSGIHHKAVILHWQANGVRAGGRGGSEAVEPPTCPTTATVTPTTMGTMQAPCSPVASLP